MSKQEIIAMVLEQDNDAVSAKISTISEEDLPEGDVTVRIDYSTLNYKDAMILKGIGKLVRKFPHVPGVDFSGVVEKAKAIISLEATTSHNLNSALSLFSDTVTFPVTSA